MTGLINYLRETRGELKHVSWPTQKQAISYTIVVMLISIGTGLFLGVLDYLFSKVLQHFI